MSLAPTPLRVLLATATLGLLVVGLAACGSTDDSTASDTQQIEVKITDGGCDPTDLEATAGPTTIVVSNDDSSINNEFEVLDGSAIIGEEENVTAGLTAEVSIDLDPGTYDIVCGNPGDREPTGTLKVTG